MSDPTQKAQSAARLRADLDAGKGRDDATQVTAEQSTDKTPGDRTHLREVPSYGIRDADVIDPDTPTTTDQRGPVRVPGVDSAKPHTATDPKIGPSGPGRSGLVTVAILAFVALVVLIATYP
ncbi:MAG: hypothetical protein II336_01440 [Loktanella sp.]|nr:hypothetical protein [Loktanella sp.]